jgi:flagellum-specific peptidoglycan hydrolase FlgJ
MPIYRQLFDFLSLASIAISIAKTERERRRSPKHAKPSEHSSYHLQGGASSNLLPMVGSTYREVPKAQERSGGTEAKGRCDSPRSWRVRSMDADLPSSRRATQPVAMPISRRRRQSRRRSSATSRATACSKGEAARQLPLSSFESFCNRFAAPAKAHEFLCQPADEHGVAQSRFEGGGGSGFATDHVK